MAKIPLEKIRNLNQKPETWEVAVCLARTWISPEHENPYRPWYVMVVSDQNKVIRNGIYEQPPTADEIQEELLKAMKRPMLGSGSKRRPQKLIFDDEALLQELAPVLDAIEIASEFRRDLPFANPTLRELEQMMNRGYPEPESLLSIPGATVPLLGKVFEAAADFYRIAPWELLPYEVAMEIRYPVDGATRYAVVMGGAGESFGIFVSDDLVGLQRIFHEFDPPGLASELKFFSLTYDTAIYFAFDDLDAIAQYGWPIPNPNAYPSIMRFSPEKEFFLPSLNDIFWLEAVLPALGEYFENHFDVDEFERERQYTFDVGILAGRADVYLQLPIDIE
ncbi:MAG: hypothetical protein HN413_14125 [Chloroflexi bacterium]|jgi:hypothetical protein|nr:hypothetical protein [Chloroflexota bacterium]